MTAKRVTMKHRGSVLVVVFLCFLLSSVLALAADSQPSAASPADDSRMLEWQVRQQTLDKEYNVCLEHCGTNTACEKKCSKARTLKMNREHTRIFGKPMPTTDNGGP
jgi:hypothetical protein